MSLLAPVIPPLPPIGDDLTCFGKVSVKIELYLHER